MKRSGNANSLENSIAYIHGRIEAQLEGFARGLNISTELLTTRVAELLSPSRERDEQSLPALRGATGRPSAGSREMEVDSAARSRVQATAKAGKGGAVSNPMKGKKYKPGTHWTQRPENKKKLKKVTAARHKKAATPESVAA